MIPKVIHCIWFSEDEKDELSKMCMQSWKEKLPDYSIKEWSIKDVEQVIKESKYFKEALENKKWSFAADYLRLWILYNEGGIYLDCDVEIIKPFSEEMLNDGFFTCYEFNKSIEAAVMGAQKGNEMVKECLDLYKDKPFVLEDGTLNRKEIIPEIIADYLVETYSDKKYKASKGHSYIKSMHIYPYYFFSPKNKYRGRIESNENTYAIHHFNGAWFSKSEGIKHCRNETIKYYLRKYLSYSNNKKVVKLIQKIYKKR